MAEQVGTAEVSIALDMKKNRIRIHKPTVHMLGDPKLIQLLQPVKKGRIMRPFLLY